MDLSRIPPLQAFVGQTLHSGVADPEALAYAQNFLWDERPPVAGADLYARHIGPDPIHSLDHWTDRHKNYAEAHLNLDPEEPERPWTFRAANDINRLRAIDPRLNLIRVERAEWPCSEAGITFLDLQRQMTRFAAGEADAQGYLQRFTTRWNERRDQRPMFATTELEVETLLAQDDATLAERLRDRLGLGHLSPTAGGASIEVLVMRYTVAEVLAALDHGQGHPAVPTVLDMGMSPYFFPSPQPGLNADPNPWYGHTLNLAPLADDNDYQIGVELLHPRLEYRPEHLYRAGVIARPIQADLGHRRGLHLPWVRLVKDRDDYGR